MPEILEQTLATLPQEFSATKKEALLSTEQAAEHLGVLAATMGVWRAMAKNPKRYRRSVPLIPYVKIGGAVRYKLSDLDKFIADHYVDPADGLTRPSEGRKRRNSKSGVKAEVGA